MSKKYPGGFITSTPPIATSGSSYGIWTMQQVTQKVNGGFWPGNRSYYIGYGSLTLSAPRTYAASTSSSYILGSRNISGVDRSVFYKLDSSGNVLANYYISSNGSATPVCLNVDGSGNVYISEDDTSPDTIKLDSSLVYQSAYRDNAYSYSSAAYIDTSGNTYRLLPYSVSSTYYFRVTKINSSGVIQFTRDIGNFYYPYQNFIYADSSGNIYLGGASTDFSSGYRGVIIKLGSTGTTTWYREYSPTSSTTFVYDTSVSGSGDIYLVGSSTYDSGGTYQAFIQKLNSSGTSQWIRRLTFSATSTYLARLVIDGSGNSYAVGTIGTSGVLVKYNTSGAIQWQRNLSASSGYVTFNNIQIDSNNDLYIAGILSAAPTGTSAPLAFKVKNDGSGTGAYTFGSYTLTYASSSYTDTTSGLSLSSASYANNSATTTTSSGSSTLTNQSGTFFMKAVV